MNESVIIPIKVVLRSQNSQVVGWENEELKIKLKAVPEKGKANEELISLLSKTFKIPKSQISIIQGLKSTHKKVSISNSYYKRVSYSQ